MTDAKYMLYHLFFTPLVLKENLFFSPTCKLYYIRLKQQIQHKLSSLPIKLFFCFLYFLNKRFYR